MRVPRQTIQSMVRLWLLLVATGLTLTVGLAAHAAWLAIVAHGNASPPPMPAATGYESEDHFPGAALIYATASPAPLVNDIAAPAQGVTGTTDLPALPISAAVAAAALANSGRASPAPPFSTRTASTLDRGRALECLTAAIYYEAASEPDSGQAAVAQVILNRVRHPAFPGSVCGVVYQGSERAGCQFSFACDGAMARVPSRAGWARAARAAAMALTGYVYVPVGLATHYHTYAVTPAWNRSLVMTDVVGAHFFHRWKGFWGTSAAFRQVYRGGEPVPGPHRPLIAPPLAASPAVIATNAAAPIAAVAQVGPADTASGGYVGTAARTGHPSDGLPPASTVLDRWKDSGKPLL